MIKARSIPSAFAAAALLLGSHVLSAGPVSGLSPEYSMSVSKDGEVRVVFSWPERFGRKIAVVPLNVLSLSKATVRPDRGAMEGSWVVTVPTQGKAQAVTVQSWPVSIDGSFSSQPAGTYKDDELVWHSPSKADAEQTLAALRKAAP